MNIDDEILIHLHKNYFFHIYKINGMFVAMKRIEKNWGIFVNLSRIGYEYTLVYDSFNKAQNEILQWHQNGKQPSEFHKKISKKEKFIA